MYRCTLTVDSKRQEGHIHALLAQVPDAKRKRASSLPASRVEGVLGGIAAIYLAADFTLHFFFFYLLSQGFWGIKLLSVLYPILILRFIVSWPVSIWCRKLRWDSFSCGPRIHPGSTGRNTSAPKCPGECPTGCPRKWGCPRECPTVCLRGSSLCGPVGQLQNRFRASGPK